MEKFEEIIIEYYLKQFELVTPYPSVARRLFHATKRALEAYSVEDVNEVGLNCRELLIDYANQVYSPEYSETDIKGVDTKDLLKDTINYYTNSGGDRGVVDSLNSYVDKVVRELHTITHSSSVYPEHTFLCINLCISLIISIEALVLLNERKSSPIFEYFGVMKCPKCKSLKLETCSHNDEEHDEMYYFVRCSECGWGQIGLNNKFFKIAWEVYMTPEKDLHYTLIQYLDLKGKTELSNIIKHSRIVYDKQWKFTGVVSDQRNLCINIKTPIVDCQH